MAGPHEINNMALFCDFENVAIGVRDVNYAQFDINKVLERLLLKGSIVVKKAYCDWERYKDFKKGMHEAAFELIEIPHVRMSGKNSADIRMVVDALDLCYTKAHVDAFVIISGDSDFSPLVSKLRENNKYVIGVGVKASTSDLLSGCCDEFIYYDDLVRAQEAKKARVAKKVGAKAPAKEAAKAAKESREAGKDSAAKDVSKEAANDDTREAKEPAREAGSGASRRKAPKSEEEKRQEGLDFLVEIVEELALAGGADERISPSKTKHIMQRRKPGFNEAYFGYRSFREMVEDAEREKLLAIEIDGKTGNYHIRYPASK
jgi:uncharacterized protein (TIGR00288 family)